MDPMMMSAVTALLGNLMSSFGGSDAERGSSYSSGQMSHIDDVLQSLKGGPPNITQNQGYGQGQDWLMSMFNDPEFYNKFEAPMQRQFQEQTVPDLANRFAAQGSGGSLGSTGFRNQLAREGSNLHTNIAAQRGQMQQGAIPQLLQYAQQPVSNYYQGSNAALGGGGVNNQYLPATAGPWGPGFAQMSGAFAQGAGQQWGQNMANPNPGQSMTTY